VVRGQNSELLTSETANRMVSSGASVELTEIPDTGHAVLMDSPQALIESAKAFLT